jgi:formate hydrogenlyase subunit 6/NADH:ubiquinone oxidoreductase subunit I
MPADRRDFLRAGAALLLPAVACRTRQADAPTTLLPPPGARDLGHYRQTCIRCLRCAAACPVGALRGLARGVVERDLPSIDALNHACILCMKCTEVCPTDALTPLSSIAEMEARGLSPGTAAIDPGRCIKIRSHQRAGRPAICRICYDICPLRDEAIRLDGKTLEPQIHGRHCVGCGLCAELCPVQAITVARQEQPG